MLIKTWFENIFKCHYNILKKKICFYQNVFLSLYLNILCKNIACDVGLTLEKINLDKITTSNPIFIGTT